MSKACVTSKIITFLESLHQGGWFDIFKSDIQVHLIVDHLITLWGNFDIFYVKLLNDTSVASACSYVRTLKSQKQQEIATIRNFHLPGSLVCLLTWLKGFHIEDNMLNLFGETIQLTVLMFQWEIVWIFIRYREYPCFGLAAILTGILYCVQIIQKNSMHME